MLFMPMSGMDKVVLVTTLAATLFIYLRNRTRSALPYPPGPAKLPLLGNVLDFPRSFPWETYARWAKELDSDIIHLSAVGKDFILLNSFKAATDLLDKKSAIYSDSMGWDWLFSSMPYGEPWRERRRTFQQYFSNRSTHVYQTHQIKFARKALLRLLDHSEDFFGIIHHLTGGVAISLAYGFKIQDVNDPFIDLSQRAFQSALNATLPGAFLVDVIPWLKYVPEWVPGAGFQKKAKAWRKLQAAFRELPYAEAVKSLASGTAMPSFTSHWSEKLVNTSDSRRQEGVVKDVGAIVFAGANDTTVAAIKTFFAAMLSFPEVQNDEPNLPYISALVKELLRWRPVTPLALPHQVTEDDVYGGYHVPKGAFVIANAWAMLHDEEDYPDPFSFRPERFLTEDGKLNSAVRDPSLMAFGFGRRICPGSHVAVSMLWLWAASFLATFSVSKAVDEDGTVLEASVEYQSSSVTFHPLPFKSLEELIRSHSLAEA
ncbi:cytochrome P450 [Gymnopilus junonius]|uniref:Cytochrome P450 n=1 Tax=Gymnopilus junonius TaxID=109634 RepID=A0A9P5TT62_GYMJU|nr:cytochrome P450 [Gymnopilus junonius]